MYLNLRLWLPITVQDYIAAVEEAYKNAVEVPEGAIKIGLGTEISIAKSRGYSMNDGKENPASGTRLIHHRRRCI